MQHPHLDVETLLALHRATFGDARMEDAPPAADPAAADPPAGDAPPAADPPAPADPQAPPPDPTKLTDPAALQAELARVRTEAAGHRTGKQAEKDRADKAEALVNGLRKLIDPNASTDDPAALAAKVTDAQATARSAQVQLAVYRKAGAAGADPNALLDSVAFKTAVEKLDPTAADFASQVDAAIKAAVEANPKLKAAQGAPASGVPHPGGSGEGAPITEEQLRSMSPEQIEKARVDGRLAHLL